jgi:drug/metabolite transporter (DMT)-like permease
VPASLLGPLVLGLALGLHLSNLSLQYGAARLPANTTALTMLSEIIFASASSVYMGASELSTRHWLGGLMIVFAAILATIQHHSKEP